MAKLPQIRYTRGVQSLGRERPLGPIVEAGAVGSALQSVDTASKRMYARHIELRQESMDLETQKQVSEWAAEYQHKQFYQASDLPDDMEFEKTHTVVDEYGNKTEHLRNQIPSYEVYPELYRRKVQAIIEAQSERMPNEKIRSKWFTGKKAILDDEYAKAMTASAKQQEKYQQRRTLLNVEEAVESGNHHLALEMAKGLKDPVLRQATVNNVNKFKETSDYDLALRNEDLEQLYGALDFLTLENYQDIGYLNAHENRLWADTIRSRIRQIESRSATDTKVDIELLKKEGRTIAQEASNLRKFDPQYVSSILDQLSIFGDESGVKSIMVDIQNAFSFQTVASDLLKIPYHMRNPLIQQQLASASGDAYTSQQLTKLEKVSDDFEQMKQRDPMTYAHRAGIITPEEYANFDPNDIAGSLERMVPVAEKVQRTTGYTNGFMTGPQAHQFAQMMESSPPDKQIAMAKEIVAGVGDKYSAVYEQLSDNGLSGSHAVAGIAASEGDIPSARSIYKGQDRLNDKQINWIGTGLGEELNEFMLEHFANSYPMDEKHRSTVMQAFKAAYVSQMGFDHIGEDTINEDMASRAFEVATGGLVEYNGSITNPPQRGFGQRNWEQYVDGIHHSELAEMNDGAVPVHTTTEELMKEIKKGRIQFIDKNVLGGNEYLMLHKGQLVLGSTGHEYVFKHNQDALTVKEVNKGIAAENLARRQELVKSRRAVWESSNTLLQQLMDKFKSND